ncbi:LptF/LptG family permease [Gemmatimonas aurantiaca]|nr:LptF/LptG family permease [Gemmatimonas aurantiaca]
MIKTIDRYILQKFLTALAVVTFAVIILIVAINLVEELRHFVDHEVPLSEIVTYYVYFSGWALKTFLPVFIFLAGLFTVSAMARSNEIMAIRAAGVSMFRFTAPLLIATMSISALHFYYSEFIFPPANKRRVEIKEFSIKKRSRTSMINRHNIYRQISDSAYYIVDLYSVPDRRGSGIKLFRRDRNTLGELITAREMNFVSGGWVLIDGAHRVFDSTGETFTTFDTLPAPIIRDQPSDFERRLGKPEDMGYRELEYYISLMKRTGGPYLAELVDLKVKMSFPFTSIVVILICVPLAANRRSGGMAGPLASAAGIILVYFVAFKVTKALGAHGYIDPDWAAWSISGAFLIIALIMNYFMRK